MRQRKDIPEEVKNALKEEISQYSDRISFVGSFGKGECPVEGFEDGADLFLFRDPDDLDIGFPLVVLFAGGKAVDIRERLSLLLLRNFKY